MKASTLGTIWLASLGVVRLSLATAQDAEGDPRFGTDLGAGAGEVRVAFDQGGGNEDRALAVLRTTNGKYVVVADVSNRIGMVRLNADGSIDTGFGTGGKVVSTALSGVTAATLDSQDRILVAGTASPNDFGVARFLPDGSPDAAFAGTGSASVHAVYSGGSSGVAVDKFDRVILVGTTGGPGQFDNVARIARLTASGQLDTGFGDQSLLGQHGIASYACSVMVQGTILKAHAYGVAIDSSGNILVAGDCDSPPKASVVLSSPDGEAVDLVCGGTTLNGAAAGAGNSASAIGLDHSGRALVAGTEPTATTGVYRSFVTRLDSAYCNDPSFGGIQPDAVPGETYLDIPGTTTASLSSVATRSDGSIVEVGVADGAMLITRLHGNGSPDTTFDGNVSYRTFPFAVGSSSAHSAIIDGGRPVIAGYVDSGSPGGLDVAVLRLQSNLIFKDKVEAPL